MWECNNDCLYNRELVTITNFNLISFLVRLIATVISAVSCFIMANLIELVIELKKEVNYNAQSNFVNVRINKELVERLKGIQNQISK